jgi:hypothetical protein
MTKQLFTAADYARIHSIVFSPDYPGYKPEVVESPNGDGVKDTEKRYAHVAEKYLKEYTEYKPFNPNYDPSSNQLELAKHEYAKSVRYANAGILKDYLTKAHELSLEVAIKIGVPKPFWPVKKYSALRVLEYNASATTAPHKDFDLFTLMLYRNLPEYFKYIDLVNGKTTYGDFAVLKSSQKLLKSAQELNTQVHFGEILEDIDPKAYKATPHEVVASEGPWQYSCVYFCVPDHEAVLPSGLTVGKWMEIRKGASRYAR